MLTRSCPNLVGATAAGTENKETFAVLGDAEIGCIEHLGSKLISVSPLKCPVQFFVAVPLTDHSYVLEHDMLGRQVLDESRDVPARALALLAPREGKRHTNKA